jgi:hypothetical protein
LVAVIKVVVVLQTSDGAGRTTAKEVRQDLGLEGLSKIMMTLGLLWALLVKLCEIPGIIVGGAVVMD